MRERLISMRQKLVAALRDKAPNHDFSHVERANGMFCFLGLSPEQVERTKQEHGVYMVSSSRVNIAGLADHNVEHLAEAVAAVL